MKQGLKVKVIGPKTQVQSFLESLEKDFLVIATSRMIPEPRDPATVHVFINLFERLEAVKND